MILDARRDPQRNIWLATRRAENRYGRELRGIARQVGEITRTTPLHRLVRALEKYAALITPWAEETAMRMIEDVSRRDERAWHKAGQEIGRALRHEIQYAGTGKLMREMFDAEVVLIKSLPLEAAQRVHKSALQIFSGGRRNAELAEEIAQTGHVTLSRANTIARTEVSRVGSLLTQTRAEHVGSPGYRWRTAGDSDVRKEHKKLEGKLIPWNKPPVAGTNGMRYHAGQGPNCRCWAEVELPE